MDKQASDAFQATSPPAARPPIAELHGKEFTTQRPQTKMSRCALFRLSAHPARRETAITRSQHEADERAGREGEPKSEMFLTSDDFFDGKPSPHCRKLIKFRATSALRHKIRPLMAEKIDFAPRCGTMNLRKQRVFCQVLKAKSRENKQSRLSEWMRPSSPRSGSSSGLFVANASKRDLRHLFAPALLFAK